MAFMIPPGGFAGFSQMTAASRLALGGRRAGGKRRSKGKKTRAAKRTKRAKGGKRKSRMKFGSPAWQKKYKVGRFAKKRR